MPARSGNVASVSIGERIARGSETFDKSRISQYTPQEGDEMGLFFALLLANLPMHTVAPVWSTRTQRLQLPNNATRVGFHRAYGPRFQARLGEAPSLWTWQTSVGDFLTEWCPPGKPNAFKWKDAATATVGGNWTLSQAEIDRIAYQTTYEYAHALMQYEATLNA